MNVHYHFPSKADLGRALMVRYRDTFALHLDAIDREETEPRRKLERFVALFEATLSTGDKLCLCGMLASEFETLPQLVRDEVRTFYALCESWLTQVLLDGKRRGQLSFDGPASGAAQTFFSSLEGAMISARAFSDCKRLTGTARWLITTLTG